MRAPAAFLLLLAFPLTLLAAPPAVQPTVAVITTATSTCPVGFDVRRNSPGLVANVGDPSRHRDSQRIFFTLSPTGERTPRSIELTVHAISPGARLFPAQGLSEPTPDIHRHFQLSLPETPGPHGRNLWVDNVGGILSVDLKAITYTDGSTWHASPESTCHVIPNGFTLVSGTP